MVDDLSEALGTCHNVLRIVPNMCCKNMSAFVLDGVAIGVIMTQEDHF